MPPRARRTDSTQRDIVEGLRAVGCRVQLLHEVGYGCPDLLCSHPQVATNVLLEVKTKAGRLSQIQKAWHADWPGPCYVVRSLDDALEAMGLVAA